MKFPSADLAQTELFTRRHHNLPIPARVRLSYARACAIVQTYKLTVDDVLNFKPKFWQLCRDPIINLDGATGTVLTLHYNMCCGTLATYADKQPELKPLLDELLAFKAHGQYCLTEVGFGLDAINMQTTATLLPDGCFELDTPSPAAAKYMPPTTPVGIPCIAIVQARLMVNGDDRGVKPFVLRLNDGKQMTPGIESRQLPPRGGSCPVNHAITYFHRVRVPATALLGSAEKPSHPKLGFFESISRVAVGTLALGSAGLPALAVSSYIASRYSSRRTVYDGATKLPRPILAFRTQQIPILAAVSQYYVLEALHQVATAIFSNKHTSSTMRHCIATIFKVTCMTMSMASVQALGERCGAQGAFDVNKFSEILSGLRGGAIAEGDLLVVSIKFSTEVLLGRHALPKSENPDSLLAKHETGLVEEFREILSMMESHRTPEFDRQILPHLMTLMEAIGHRMAYDAAVYAEVPRYAVDMFVAQTVKADAAWYVENAGMTRKAIRQMESDAVEGMFPHLEELLEGLEVEPYITAPIVSESAWSSFVDSLEVFGGPVKAPTIIRQESMNHLPRPQEY